MPTRRLSLEELAALAEQEQTEDQPAPPAVRVPPRRTAPVVATAPAAPSGIRIPDTQTRAGRLAAANRAMQAAPAEIDEPTAQEEVSMPPSPDPMTEPTDDPLFEIVRRGGRKFIQTGNFYPGDAERATAVWKAVGRTILRELRQGDTISVRFPTGTTAVTQAFTAADPIMNHNHVAGANPRCALCTFMARCVDRAPAASADEAAPVASGEPGTNGTARPARAPRARVPMSDEVRERLRGPKGEPRACLEGCGEMTSGGKFRPGHDARLAGLLRRRAAWEEEFRTPTQRRNNPFPEEDKYQAARAAGGADYDHSGHRSPRELATASA